MGINVYNLPDIANTNIHVSHERDTMVKSATINKVGSELKELLSKAFGINGIDIWQEIYASKETSKTKVSIAKYKYIHGCESYEPQEHNGIPTKVVVNISAMFDRNLNDSEISKASKMMVPKWFFDKIELDLKRDMKNGNAHFSGVK